MSPPDGGRQAASTASSGIPQPEALYQLAHDIVRAPDLNTIANVLFTHAQRMLGADYAFLLLADPSGTELHGVAALGPQSRDFAHERIDIHNELVPAALAFQRRQTVIITDRQTSTHISDRLRQQYPFVKSSWLVPLLQGERPIGILSLGYAHCRRPTDTEVHLLELLGDEATLALVRVRVEEDLRESEERHRLMFEKNRAVKLLIDPQSGAILDANPAAAAFYGYDRPTLQRMRITDLNRLPAEEVRTAMTQASREQRQSFHFQHRLASGEIRDVEVYSSPLVLRGRPVLYSIIHDITERIHAEKALRSGYMDLEQRVAERTAALQHTIAELQQFARLASHDLQEPLRMVSSYVQLLALHYRGQLDAQADEWITAAVDGTKRLQRLVLDLLTYYEVSTYPLNIRQIDSEALLIGALTDLRGAIAERGATVTHDPLPAVWGDARLLQLVLRNLISNGIKFHGAVVPHVHVSASRHGETWQFSVQDNGVGLMAEDRNRIFLPFQRLHTLESYPKPGIGLAICRKIIERHGGRIWVESRPGKGSIFLFTVREKSTRHSRAMKNYELRKKKRKK